jgi:uncharacterized membrane protein
MSHFRSRPYFSTSLPHYFFPPDDNPPRFRYLTHSMNSQYNRLAGHSVERLAALSDGIFAVAMTLLAIDLRLPAAEIIHSDRDLFHALLGFAPNVLVYFMSFLTLGIFWVGQQAQLNHLKRSNVRLTWIHLLFLFAVTLLPISTKFLAEFLNYRTTLLTYWFNILIFGAVLYISWGYATRNALIKDDLPREIPAAICRRILIAQALYALAASLCFFSTRLSIALIVLFQLNYVVAPGFRETRAEEAADS